jgi:hypothetical protein
LVTTIAITVEDPNACGSLAAGTAAGVTAVSILLLFVVVLAVLMFGYGCTCRHRDAVLSGE